MITNTIISGGAAHEYRRTSELLAGILEAAGIRSTVCDGIAAMEDGSIRDRDLMTLNCCYWTRRESPETRHLAVELSPRALEHLSGFVAEGKGILALHAATLCFDDWPEYRRILGAWWVHGTSSHAPCQEHLMRVHAGRHPVVQGMRDFRIVDELYTDPALFDALDPLVEAEWEGKLHPMVWVRTHGRTRMCYDALGHGEESFTNEHHQRLLQRGALWAAGRL